MGMTVTTITLIAAIAFTVIGVGAFFHLFLMILWWPCATGTVSVTAKNRSWAVKARYLRAVPGTPDKPGQLNRP
jgi:hypothetical protein